MSFITRNLRKIQDAENFNTKGSLEISKDAIIESIVNALIHREFAISSTIRVFLFKDRLEVISPGCLTNHLSEEKIRSGTSIARNQTMQNIAQYILPYSGLGRGVQRMIKLEPSVKFKNDKVLNTFVVVFKRG